MGEIKVGRGNKMRLPQLKKELESYKEKKPWREKTETEENTKPLGKSKSDLET